MSIPHSSDGVPVQAKEKEEAGTSAADVDGAERTTSQPEGDAADFGAQMRAAASARRNAMGDEPRRREVMASFCSTLAVAICGRATNNVFPAILP